MGLRWAKGEAFLGVCSYNIYDLGECDLEGTKLLPFELDVSAELFD